MKKLLAICFAATLCAGAVAQNLDTVGFTDQLNSGSRGNNIATTGSASYKDGSEYLDYNGADLSGTATFIRYINTWVIGEVESPIMNVTTAQNNPDYPTAPTNMAVLPIPANNRPGATGGDTAMFVADDGGYNSIFFGESDDKDYFAEVDMYCVVYTPSTPAKYEVSGIAVRAARNNDPNMTDATFNVDRAGSYALIYDVHTKTISARKWTTGNSVANIYNRVASTYTEFGTLPLVTSGWHTLKIVANGTSIGYFVDGVELVTVTDSTFANGRPGLYYREGGTTATRIDPVNEIQGIFDHLRAGPASTANINDWNLY